MRVRLPRSGRAVATHLLLAVGFCFCWAAGWFELTRARSGHTIAWVYTFEWPFFAVALAYMWVRGSADARPPRTSRRRQRDDIPDDDPGLRAWRGYLAELGHEDTTTDRAPGSG